MKRSQQKAMWTKFKRGDKVITKGYHKREGVILETPLEGDGSAYIDFKKHGYQGWHNLDDLRKVKNK